MVLVAAVAATIYREIDGPTVRSSISANINLNSINSTLCRSLESAQKANTVAQNTIAQLTIDLQNSRPDHAALQDRLETYLTSVPWVPIDP